MTQRRRVVYVSGTRADFGLMVSTLQRIAADRRLELQVVVTGMHLSERYGGTVREIEAAGLPVAARIAVDVESRTEVAMAAGVGTLLAELAPTFARLQPHVVLVLGDRGEMLAAALAGLHLGIPVAHLHGGERSGTVDEPVRHAITKLSHWHFAATPGARERIMRMGENPEHVWVTGAPALDGLDALAAVSRAQVLRGLGLPADASYVLVLFHPVVQEARELGDQTVQLAGALQDVLPPGCHVVWLAPNSDAGSAAILAARDAMGGVPVHRIAHLPRPLFVAALRHAAALIGNSSAGIIEAGSLGTPVVNIGSRQRARERNANTLDCDPARASVAAALRQALAHGPYPPANRYGDGQAGPRIVELLATQPISPALLDKVNSY